MNKNTKISLIVALLVALLGVFGAIMAIASQGYPDHIHITNSTDYAVYSEPIYIPTTTSTRMADLSPSFSCGRGGTSIYDQNSSSSPIFFACDIYASNYDNGNHGINMGDLITGNYSRGGSCGAYEYGQSSLPQGNYTVLLGDTACPSGDSFNLHCSGGKTLSECESNAMYWVDFTVGAPPPPDNSIIITIPTATTTQDFAVFQGDYTHLTGGEFEISVDYGQNGIYDQHDYNFYNATSGTYSIPKSTILNFGVWNIKATIHAPDETILAEATTTITIGSLPSGDYPTSSASSSLWVMGCDPSQSWWQYSLCYLAYGIFVPTASQQIELSDYVSSTLKAGIVNKPPFGYFTIFSNALGGLQVGTTSISFAAISVFSPYFDPIKSMLNVIIIVAFIGWIFVRFKHLQL